MKQILMAMILMGVATMGKTEIRTEEVTYSGGGVEMKGLLAWDDAIEGKRPGILVVHEWWGHNAYPRERARMLAELGYTAMALDMYGEGKSADHPDSAGAFMNAALENMDALRARFEAAYELLKAHETVESGKMGAIGYCFGGGVVLHMARMGADLKAVASFHGSLPLVKAPGPDRISARVVAYHGEADPLVPSEAVAAFRAELDAVGARYDLVTLPGAMHGFSNPAATENGQKFGLPLRYSPLGDKASWAHMQLVFHDAFSD